MSTNVDWYLKLECPIKPRPIGQRGISGSVHHVLTRGANSSPPQGADLLFQATVLGQSRLPGLPQPLARLMTLGNYLASEENGRNGTYLVR